jgi:Skp family chaperone for outer membrane proteins
MARAARRGRGRLSAIEQLPPEADAIIIKAAGQLRDRDLTQQDIFAEFFAACQALQTEHHGELEFSIPSKSAFNRYSIRLAMMTRRLEETREIAGAISERLDAKSSDDVTMLAAQTIKSLVWEILMDAGEGGVAPKEAMALANALRAATQAQNISTSRRQKIESEFAEQVDDAVETVAKVKGLTTETVEAIKAQILGVAA